MRDSMTKMKNTAKRPFFLMVALLIIAACEAPKSAADYRDDFPLIVGEETVSLPLVIPFDSKGFSKQEQDRITSFVNDFLNRGNGRITVETGAESNGGGLVSSRIEQVQKALTGAGAGNSDIVFKTNNPNITGYGKVNLSFQASTVDIPECGDWSTSASYNWSARRHYNFGCSVQRNIGLMVADPADLKQAKPVTGQGAYRARVLSTHRAGTPTGSLTSLPAQKTTTK